MKRIVCYGDSNTWGYIPGSGARYDETCRWTALLQTYLGDKCAVIEAGMNARTTSFDDPYCDFLNGRKGLFYTLLAAKPIDLVIISLGTNDLKFTNAHGSAKGLESLLNTVLSANCVQSDSGTTPIFPFPPKILVLSPITLSPEIDTLQPPSSLSGKYSESLLFSSLYRDICQSKGTFFLDASSYATASPSDYIHMDQKGHKQLAHAVLNVVKDILF